MDNYKRLGGFNSGLLANLVKELEPKYGYTTRKQEEEATEAGLELLSKSTNRNYNLYRFSDCNHTSFLQPTHVRNNTFKCSTCYLQNLILSSDKLGDLFVCRSGGTRQISIRQCGHISETNSPHKRGITKRTVCVMCTSEKIHQVAKLNGYEVLASHSNTLKEIRFNDCGHTKIVQLNQIHKGNVVCRSCKLEAHSALVREVGLSFLSNSQGRYNLYSLPCGCNKILRADHAEQGVWQCHNCTDNYYTLPSSLYLLEITYNGFTWLKLGFAKNIDVRVRSYGLPMGSRVSVLLSIPFDRGYECMCLEKEIHKEYKDWRLPPVNMKEYHRFNGQTECYTIVMKQILMLRLRRVNNV